MQDRDFGSYWFESGTPTFLVKTLQNQPVQLQSILNGRKATEDQFKNYDPESKNMLPVIYQSGYLTIKDFEKKRRIYTLGFPNEEIENGFLNAVLKKFVKVPDDDLGLAIDNLCIALTERNIDLALTIIQTAIADEGLKQIDEKGYSDRFAVSGKTMHKIVLVFSSDAKGLLGWKTK